MFFYRSKLLITFQAVPTLCRRSNFNLRSREELRQLYNTTKKLFESKKLPPDVNLKQVFACNRLDLKEIDVYGFDYDYTLACYKPEMGYTLYNLGRDILIDKYKYPEEIRKLDFNPDFAIRGLHYDIQKGLLMKLDSFLQVELGTVYKGLTPLSDEQVISAYRNRKLPFAYLHRDPSNPSVGGGMVQLADLFSVPEISLLCNVAEYFEEKHIDYHPEILFSDVKESIGQSHGIMHNLVLNDTGRFLEKHSKLRLFFEQLLKAKKKLFLITNSPFKFVDCGMKLILGSDWEMFFDLIIVEARKPRFFTDQSRPFRIYDRRTDMNLWDRVTALQKGNIYHQGTITHLLDLTGWKGQEVLYFGDHPYSDLADVTMQYGWRTGAIISELAHEIESLNSIEFKRKCNWLQMLIQLMEEEQNCSEDEMDVLQEWKQECDDLRKYTKCVFNKQFGSVFRTHHNPTYFSRRLFRFSDIYTSSIINLLEYPINHCFYPRRGVMPHEYTSYFV